MNKRINIQEIEPDSFKAMFSLERYLATTALSKTHKALIKIRASQINRCAFCIDMHTKDALKDGESNQRLFLLNAWRETELFTEEEKIILAITEEITLIHHEGLTEETYQKARKAFNENYLGIRDQKLALIYGVLEKDGSIKRYQLSPENYFGITQFAVTVDSRLRLILNSLEKDYKTKLMGSLLIE